MALRSLCAAVVMGARVVHPVPVGEMPPASHHYVLETHADNYQVGTEKKSDTAIEQAGGFDSNEISLEGLLLAAALIGGSHVVDRIIKKRDKEKHGES